MRKIWIAILGVLLIVTTNAQTITPAGGTLALGNILVSESTNGSHNFTFSAENAADLGIGGGSTVINVIVPTDAISYLFIGKSSSGPWSSQISFTTDEDGNIASETIYVKFTPDFRGLKSKQLLLSEENEICSASKSLSMRGVTPEIQISGNSNIIADGDETPVSTDYTHFGTIDPGNTQDRTFTITNTAGTTTNDGDLKLTGSTRVVIGGTHASEFTVQTQPSTPITRNGSTTTFTVRFTPSASGTRSANLSIANNDLDENPYNFAIQGIATAPEIDIQGNGNSISDGDVSPSLTDFTDFGSGDVFNCTVEKTYSIGNSGEYTLILSDNDAPNGVYVWIDGDHASDFSVSLQPSSSIAESGSDDFSIVFNPTAEGVRNAVVHVSSNDVDEGSYEFAISGTGVTPEIDIQGNSVSISDGDESPSTLDHTDFGGTSVSEGTVARTFTIYNQNSGSYPGCLNLSGASPYLTISGDHSADFTVTSPPSNEILSGANTSFQITFNPSASGVRSAIISISSNDLNESTYSFAIQGTGAGVPTVTTTSATSILATAATSGGNISSDGGSEITVRGVCWSTTENPDLSDSHSSDGTGSGSFASNLSGLSPESFYYMRAYATNSVGTSYGESRSFWTLSTEPGTHPSDLTASNITNSEVDLTWTEPGGTNGYIILKKTGDIAPTSEGVSDGMEQTFFSLPSGTTVAAEVVDTNAVTISGLSGNQDYSFAIITYARSAQEATYNYKTDGTLETVNITTLKAAPTTQTLNVTFSGVQESQMTINWTRGNGDSCLVLMREAFAINSNPVNYNSYNPGTSSFDDGSQIGSGNYVVYTGTGTSVTVNGLDGSTTYFVKVYEYNNGGITSVYQTANSTSNPASQATIKPTPTTQASNIVISNIDNTSLTLSWTRGNGDNVLVIGSVGNNLTDPVTNTDYAANNEFGSGDITGTGCFVLFKGNASTANITGLDPETNYYFKVLEFNNLGTSYQRYITTAGTNNPNNATTLKSEPTIQASEIVITNITSNSATASWTRGNGEYTMLVARENGSVSNPSNNTTYTADSAFAEGSQIGTSGTYVLYIGTDTDPSAEITGLKPNRTYYFKTVEYNNHGTSFIKYNSEETSNNPGNFTTNNEAPSVQATNLVFSSINFNSTTISWTNGDGQRRIVLINDTSEVDALPANGSDYTPNSTFGAGDEIGTGNFVVYDGTGTNVSISGLTAATNYYVHVFEYNGSDLTTLYNTTDSTNNPLHFSTLKSNPDVQALNLIFSEITTDSITLSWERGNGDYCLVVAKSGSVVNSNPTDGNVYTANSIFGTGSQIGAGNYVVYKGTGNTLDLSGLTGNTTYHFKIFEFNNNTLGTTRYLTSDATNNPSSQATENGPPSVQATNIVYSNIEETSFTVSCTKGNGQNRIIVLNSVNSFTNPTNGQDPVANTDWASSGEQVVYNGSGNSVDITSLSAATTYYLRIFEFNNTGENTLFNTSTGTNNPNSQSTLKLAPTTQASEIVFSSLTATSMTLAWTNGNGDSRIVLMNSDNSFTSPVDGTSPSADNSWNNSGEQVVFNGSGSTVSITGLTSGNTYWFRVYEFNNTSDKTRFYTETATQNPNSQQTIGTVTWLGGSGGNETNWETGANWSNGNVPSSATNVVINTATDIPVISSSAICNNLSIDPNCFLTINDGASLTVNGTLTIDCNTSAETGQIRVIGDGTITAATSLVNFYIIGSDYKLVSSPNSSATIANTFTGFYAKKYTETDGWSAASASLSMTPMKAFGIKYYNTRTTTFNGTLNNGQYSASISASGTTEDDGWNLVGNPYISSIDWKASSGWDKTGIDNTVYIHIGSGQYATFNGTTNASTNGGSRYIAPMQGFFVHRSSVGSSTISMNNSVRVTVASEFLKNSADLEPNDMIKLELSSNSFTDETAILFYPGASEEFDQVYDALKIIEEDNINPKLYSIVNGNQRMDINTLPQLSQTVTIPIGLHAPMAAPCALNLKTNSMSSDIQVTLEDLHLKKSVNLSQNLSYSFETTSSNINDRFLLHMTRTSLNVSNEIEPSINIYSFDKTIKIVDYSANTDGHIYVYNVIGELIKNIKLVGNTTYTIDLPNTGSYVVKYQTDKKVTSKKVIVY